MSSRPKVVAWCGRNNLGEIIDPDSDLHFTDEIYLTGQPDGGDENGDGWFLPMECDACIQEGRERMKDPAYAASVFAEVGEKMVHLLDQATGQRIIDEMTGHRS